MAQTREPEDKYIDLGGVRLHCLDWGGTSTRPLVLLHGITGNAHSWDLFARSVCDEFRVYALDQRGHGLSAHAEDGYSLKNFVSDLANFVDATRIVPFDLVGLSLGARNAMGFAGLYSPTLRHLVLVDMAPEMDREGARNVRRRVGSAPTSFSSPEEALSYLKENNPRANDELLQIDVQHRFKRDEQGRLVYRHDPRLFEITGPAALEEIPYLWGMLTQINCPTLVVRGVESDILSPQLAARMINLIPNSMLVEVEQSGHPVPLDNPKAFEAVVSDFLAS